jgi:hypothetical protein
VVHENRQVRSGEHLSGCSAQQEFDQSAAGVSSHHEKVGTDGTRLFDCGNAEMLEIASSMDSRRGQFKL